MQTRNTSCNKSKINSTSGKAITLVADVTDGARGRSRPDRGIPQSVT